MHPQPGFMLVGACFALFASAGCETRARTPPAPEDGFKFTKNADGTEDVFGMLMFNSQDSFSLKALDDAFTSAARNHCGGDFEVVSEGTCFAHAAPGSPNYPGCSSHKIRCTAVAQ